MSELVERADWTPVFLIGDSIAQAVDGCTCNGGVLPGRHKPGCGLEPIGPLATPAHDALVRETYGSAIAETIAEAAGDILDHPPCFKLNCCDCARRHMVEKVIRIARHGDGVAAHLDGGDDA